MTNLKFNFIKFMLVTTVFVAMYTLSLDSLLAASDPFSSIQTNIESLYTKIATIVKIVCTIALVIFLVVCLITQEFNKFRFFVMVSLLVLIGIAKPLVEFFMSWGASN